MSDTPQGDGWWQASDGKWYSPEQHPTAATPATPATPPATPATPPPTPPAPGTGGPHGTQPPGAQAPGAQPPGATDGTAPEDEQGKGKGKVIAIVIAVLLLVAAAIAGVVLFTGDDDEPDSGPSTTEQRDIGDATGELANDGPIEFNTEYDDALEGTRTEARYTLDAPDGAIMTLTVTNDEASERGVFTTFESSGERFAAFRVAPSATETETIILAGDGGAPFDLIFTEGPASFTFEVGLRIQDDAGKGGDAGSEFADAFAVDAGQDVDGLLGGQDQTDRYTLDLEPGTEFTMEAAVERSSERGAFYTVELDGERLFAERVQPGADTTFSALLSDTDEGTLEVIVTEGPADYSFTADFVEQSEGGSPGDASADLSDARTVDASAAITGSVGGRDEGDHYLFTAPAATVTVTASADASSERGVFVTLQDDSGSSVGSFRVQPGAEAVETIEVAAGSTVRLIVTEGPGSYSITLS